MQLGSYESEIPTLHATNAFNATTDSTSSSSGLALKTVAVFHEQTGSMNGYIPYNQSDLRVWPRLAT
jgi:hypothetical protein